MSLHSLSQGVLIVSVLVLVGGITATFVGNAKVTPTNFYDGSFEGWFYTWMIIGGILATLGSLLLGVVSLIVFLVMWAIAA